MRYVINSELDFEGYNQFIQNLNYQISKTCGFYKKIPTFYEKLADFENAFNERESMLLFKCKFEGKRSRDAYKIIMQELEEVIKKYHEKNIKSE
jgi:hypothetical protein